ncbi:NUDIX hydrolase [Hyphomicrobium sp.]|uniref:NUDIX hydrolase n=1 Tax=Hyphomicrobium sp. TaxID=82 RepID=UPI0025C0C4C1|nr:NUDIX hydrolase [Hyphomicrobium sp.]MCC7250391.1 NUDIX hydrolase [Hyphomicrobium sp.]
MAERPASVATAQRTRLRPRDAATLLVIDHSAATPRVLMGRRRPDQVFLPDTFVFPGGRVEAADRTFARHHPLPPREAACLKIAMRGRASDLRAAALALAAVRETFEETGFIVGERSPHDGSGPAGGWSGFLAEGFRPRLGRLAFFARAITPPGRARRYDTRFFIVDAAEVAHRAASMDGELLDIDWFTIDHARRLKLPSITRHVLEDLARHLARPKREIGAGTVPFYFHRHGRQERLLLQRAAGK